MDRRFCNVRAVHALVAECRIRILELVAHAAGLFRPSGAHHVLHRLVSVTSQPVLLDIPLNASRFPPGNRKNRPFVETNAENVLRRIDLMNIEAHYARSAASGFWLLQLGDRIIGMVGIDASLDATNDEPVTQQSQERLKASIKQKGTSRVATIRHFFAEEAYRSVNIEDDLLQFALESTFSADKAVKSVRVTASPLRPAVLESLQRNKFTRGDRVGTIGIRNWEVYWYTMERSQWEAGKEK